MIVLREDFDTRRIIISPNDAPPYEAIAYDLHVGSTYQEPGNANTFILPKVYELGPGHSILAVTKETLSVPDDVLGLLCSKGSLTALGLFVGNTKIDPLFHGQLKVSIFNASSRPLELHPDDAFCSIVFVTVEHPVRTGTPRRSPEMPCQKRSRTWDFLRAHRVQIIGGLITLALSGITAYAAAYAARR